MSAATGLVCEACSKVIAESEYQAKCRYCGGSLVVKYDLHQIKKSLSSRGHLERKGESLLKQWKDVLPIDKPELINKVSIGEIQTPLVRSSKIGKQFGVEDLRFKIEIGPTLSWKDRGTALSVLKAIELGFKTLSIASTGNNAASTAAYAAKAGLTCITFIKKDTPEQKISKIQMCGAKIVRINGNMSLTSKLCLEMANRHHWYLAGSPNAYRHTAMRTIAFEIIYQMNGQVPDAVVFPVGGGLGMAAGYAGFLEMFKTGIIPTLPRLIGVQLEACDPLTQVFRKGSNEIKPVEIKPSLSKSLMANNPVDWGMQTVKAARETGGLFISVSDKEFINAIHHLASAEGLFLEPAGAASVAALSKLMDSEQGKELKTVICLLSGHGLNQPVSVEEAVRIPELVEPEISAIESYLGIRT